MASNQTCDVCKKAVVWSEHHGWLHYDTKKKTPIHAAQDKSGHRAVSTWKW